MEILRGMGEAVTVETRQRTVAIVHLDRLKRNVDNIRRRLKPGVEFMAVVKGDAYGHGIAGVCPTLRRCGVTHYAAAIWEEGAALRHEGVEEPILLLGDTWDEQLSRLLEYDLTPTIFCVETAEKLNALALQAGRVCPVHIKLETGMNRIGFPADGSALDDIAYIAGLPALRITGIFTHFARADEPDCGVTERQLALLLDTVEALKKRGIHIPMVHACNSPGILLWPQAQLDAVRGGDVLFGLCPVEPDIWPQQGLEEVMTWQTYVVMVKAVPAGRQVGYGGTFTTTRETLLATLPVGFADGYSRHLSNRGSVFIRGQEAPIRGRVCMDQMMVDVTGIPGVQRGDPVELLGEHMPIWRMAQLMDSNVDEVACGISKRVPRLYTGEEDL